MDDSAFRRRHRLETVLAPAGCDTPGGAAREPSQHLDAAFPVVFDIDNDVRLSPQLAARDHADKELERLKRFAAPTDQQARVLAFDLENQRTIIIVADVRIGNNTHCTEEVVEEI